MKDEKKNDSQTELELIHQQIQQIEKELLLLREQFEEYLRRNEERGNRG
jgi:hypothetical protein